MFHGIEWSARSVCPRLLACSLARGLFLSLLLFSFLPFSFFFFSSFLIFFFSLSCRFTLLLECLNVGGGKEREGTNGREDSKQKQNNCVAKQTKTKRASEFAQCKTTQWSNAKGPPKRTKGKRNTEVWKRGWEGREDGQPD